MTTQRVVRRGPRPVQVRQLEVRRVQRLTPSYVRITFGGAALDGFVTEGADDHVKLFFPVDGASSTAGTSASAPTPAVDGAFARRDFTPRRHDAAAGELDIDFAIHASGPATSWALRAAPGDVLGIGGPRGSLIVTYDFDWYLLAGDETSIPAVARRLEDLPKGAHARVFLEVDTAADEQPLRTEANAAITWLHRNGAPAGTTDLLERAIREAAFPAGDGFAFVAGESGVMQSVRRHLLDERKLPREWTRVTGYWKRGTSDFHEEPQR